MNLPEFIYAEKGAARYYRHFVFWGSRLLFLMVSDVILSFLLEDRYTPGFLKLLRCILSLATEIGYTYWLAYYILPRYLQQRRHFAFIVILVMGAIGIMVLNGWMDRLWASGAPVPDLSFLSLWGMFWGSAGYGPPAVAAVFVILKAIKEYARTMREKEALQAENAQAELLLLKAQVHPHFLFNTLNNIYSFSRRQPDVALELIENLSSTVRYMTTECSAELVPLEKELAMIRDYIELERVRYGDRLDLQFEVRGDCREKYVDPLLLIPLVENCFKHGASQLLESPWIKVLIFAEGLVLRVEISNNRPVAASRSYKKGIGITNVQKRLNLLHPANHLLEILPGTDHFLVRMRVPLRAYPYPFP
jgi:hypothetical protein